MNFDLTEDQRAVQETFARFADEQIAPKAETIDEAHEFPREIFEQLGDLGFYGMRYPEADGGTGLDLLSLCLAVTEIARGSASVAGVATMQSLMGTNFLWALGNDDIKSRLFAPALEGRKVGGICMTEPDSGSDLGGISTYAERTNSGYKLNGQKMWVTSAPVADFFTVFAKAGPERGLTIFLIERDFEGLNIGRAIEKMGVWALPTSEVAFNDCIVPESHRLCEEGEGEQHLRTLLAQIRVITAAMAIGIARAAVDTAVQYASPSASSSARRSTASRRSSSSSPTWARSSTSRPAICTTPPGWWTTTVRTIPSRPWPSCSPARARRPSATRPPASWPPTATPWNIRRSGTCATCASR